MRIDKDMPLAQVSPLLMENHFHPLSDMDGEEDAWRIAATPPPLVFSAPPTLIR